MNGITDSLNEHRGTERHNLNNLPSLTECAEVVKEWPLQCLCPKLRLRRALIRFSDQPSSAHPPNSTPSCPRPLLRSTPAHPPPVFLRSCRISWLPHKSSWPIRISSLRARAGLTPRFNTKPVAIVFRDQRRNVMR